MRSGSFQTASPAVASLEGRTILQIIPRLDSGGVERTTIDIAAALAKVGAIAKVATQGGRLISELQAKGGVWAPFPAHSKNPLAMALNVRRLTRLIREENVEIVHARSRAPAWVALGAAKSAGICFVTTYHGAYAGRSSLKSLYNSVMARGDAVIANSEWTAAAIAERYPAARDRIHAIYRGIDLREFSPATVESARVKKLRREWGASPDERIVLIVARMTQWKGHKTLIEALAILNKKGFDDVTAIFVGDSQGRRSYERELDETARLRGLSERVRRVGHCSDIPAALLASAVVAVPSLKAEAFGRVAVEAQAMGCPVVASDLGAARETVLAPPQIDEKERTGWLAQPGEAADLARALECALNLGASARESLSERARAYAASRFSLETMCSQTLDIYQSLLS